MGIHKTAMAVSFAFMMSASASNAQLGDLSNFANQLGNAVQDGVADTGVMNVIAPAVVGKACNDSKAGSLCYQSLAMLGTHIIGQLTASDKKQHEDALDRAVRTGRTQSWNNKGSGNSGNVRVTRAPSKKRTDNIRVVKDKLETIPPLEAIGEDYVAKSTTNVRGGPGTDYVIVEKLSKGQSVTVFGKVQGKNWHLIGQDDVAVGYVSSSLLRKATDVANVREASFNTANATRQEVSMTIECRQTDVDVTLANGKTGSGTETYCNGPNGWEKV